MATQYIHPTRAVYSGGVYTPAGEPFEIPDGMKPPPDAVVVPGAEPPKPPKAAK